MREAMQGIEKRVQGYSDEKLRSCLSLAEAGLEGPIPNTDRDVRLLRAMVRIYQGERQRRRGGANDS